MKKTLLRGVVVSWMVGAAVVVAVSCASTSGGTDSNTHWLASCETSADCGGLSCVCGVCTRACTDAASCKGLGAAATCEAVASCDAATKGCVASCKSDGDCRAFGNGFSCENGQCARIDGNEGGSSGGATGTGGVTGSGGVTGTGGVTATGGARDKLDGSAGPCAPMDAQPSPVADCADFTYKWDGTRCVVLGCGCIGRDCAGIYGTAEECDHAHAACYATQGIERACNDRLDCVLTKRTCCGTCSTPTINDVVAVQESSSRMWRDRECAGNGGCPLCLSEDNPQLTAACVAGECQVVDTTPFAACQTDDDCRLTAKKCCDAGDFTDRNRVVAISRIGDADIEFNRLVCGGKDVGCDAGIGGFLSEGGIRDLPKVMCDSATKLCRFAP